jgi:hypothetical protein
MNKCLVFVGGGEYVSVQLAAPLLEAGQTRSVQVPDRSVNAAGLVR